MIYYFAYGSNLHHIQMKRRCPKCKFIKKMILKNYDLVNSDLGSKKGKFYRTIFPELSLEIRTCLQNSIKFKSVEFVFEKNIEIKEKLEIDETSGIEIKIHQDYTNSQNNLIDIKLKNNNLLEIYLEFLENIIENIRFTSNKTIVVNLVLKKINIWIKFFKKKKFEGLSEEEIRGLIGELLFIKNKSSAPS